MEISSKTLYTLFPSVQIRYTKFWKGSKLCIPYLPERGGGTALKNKKKHKLGGGEISPRNTLVNKETLVNLWSAIPCNVIIACLTSSLILPSDTIRATIFEKVFRPEKFPKTEYFPTKRIISLSSRTCKFSSRTCKLYFPPWIHIIE